MHDVNAGMSLDQSTAELFRVADLDDWSPALYVCDVCAPVYFCAYVYVFVYVCVRGGR